MATSAGEGSSYQGGAGGKFRKRPLKKPQSTPYDRPPTALRNPSWVSKMIVEPASKLVTAGARFFLSPFGQKRLAAPPPPPLVANHSRDTFQETVIPRPAGDQGPALNNNSGEQFIKEGRLEMKGSEKQKTSTDNGGVSELELMLKQKTFTRSEIDRLTELLHSRTVESSRDGEKVAEFRPQETLSGSQGKDNLARSYFQETRNESHLDSHIFHGRASTAVVSSKVLEEDVATPVELAKAYMGKKSSKVSPSQLCLRSQAMREDSGALCTSPFATRSPVMSMSLVQKPSVHGGVHENGFMTPRSRGRSAIYTMSRTPYSRIHPTASHKGKSSTYDGYGGSSASPSTVFARELVARSVSKDLALKRRISTLEDDMGSVGPIRRLRQKTNLSTAKNVSLPFARTPFSNHGTGIVSNGTLDPSSSKTFRGSEDKGNLPGTRYNPVPSQSMETARKILQQLEKFAPKENQSEDHGALNENSPSKLMPNMLRGQALRSLEDVNSSKILQEASYGLDYKQKGLLTDACETSTSQKLDKVGENGTKSFSVSNGSLVPEETGNGTAVFKDNVPAYSLSDSVKKQVVTKSFPKKWGFQMSAHEKDFLELDDEIRSSEASGPAKLGEGKKISETSVVDSKAVPVTEDKTVSVSEFKAPTKSSDIEKPTGLGTSDGTQNVDKSSGFMFSAASTFSPSIVSFSESATSTKNIPDKEPNAPPPLFNSGIKNDDKESPCTFSFGLKSTAPAEVKQETTNSLVARASDAIETVPKPANSAANGDVENMQKPGYSLGKPETLSSLPQPVPASTSSLFAVGSKPSFASLNNDLLKSAAPIFSSPASVLPTSNSGDQTLSASTGSLFTVDSKPSYSSLSNGSLKSTTPSSPVPVLPTSNSGNQTATNPFTGFAFSTTKSTAASSEVTPSLSATPSSLFPPAFKFGSTPNNTPASTATPTPSLSTAPDFKSGSSFMAPPTYSTVSTTSSVTDVKGSTEKVTSLETNLPSNPFTPPSFQMAGTGSSVFGFSAGSTSSSAAASPSQNSPFGTTNGTSNSTQSVPVFASSATSSTLGTFGSTPFSAGSSPFGSSTSSGPAFGNTTSSSFTFGSTPSFGQSTTAPSSTGFSFGAQPPAFGSSTGVSSSSSPFTFSSAAPSQPVFGNSVPAFGSAPGGNNQMTMAEDSMAEDLVQVAPAPTHTPSLPAFGQPPVSNPSPSPFNFGNTPPSSGVNPFQFGGQPSQQQNPNPFQASGSQDFGGGSGSFSLGSGGGDKAGRRMVKVKRKTGRK